MEHFLPSLSKTEADLESSSSTSDQIPSIDEVFQPAILHKAEIEYMWILLGYPSLRGRFNFANNSDPGVDGYEFSNLNPDLVHQNQPISVPPPEPMKKIIIPLENFDSNIIKPENLTVEAIREDHSIAIMTKSNVEQKKGIIKKVHLPQTVSFAEVRSWLSPRGYVKIEYPTTTSSKTETQ